MKKFVEIEGFIIAVDAIVMIHPPKKDSSVTTVNLVGDKSRSFPEKAVAELRKALDADCLHL